MFRSLERVENTARLVEAGFRIALTRSTNAAAEWRSVIETLAVQPAYEAAHGSYDSAQVVDFLLRDKSNSSSVLSIMKSARDNARMVRTALTTEVWSAVNDTSLLFNDLLKEPIEVTELPNVLATIRQQSGLVRGALYGTMLRNDTYDFCRLGTFIERMDNTARIIDVKYYSLLPSPSLIGSRLDNVQWETILRSVSAHRSFRWAVEGDFTAPAIAEFLILDRRMPRSLAFSAGQVVDCLSRLAEEYGTRQKSHYMADELRAKFIDRDIDAIFNQGLHEFVSDIIESTAALANEIEINHRFIA